MADTIKPTETNALQRLLGEVGVIAQKTGKSIDEVLASSSTKGSNVYLTALARMLLADFPQSAGAALQDYTGTTRDITPKQPYHPGVRGGSWNTYQIDPRAFDVMSLALPAASLGVKGAKVGAKAVEQGVKNLAVPTDPFFAGRRGRQRGVVKPGGGNWLKGEVEDTLFPIKQEVFDYAPGEYGYATAAEHPNNIRSAAINNWIDKKLVPYIKNEMGTPGDSVRLGIEKRVAAAEARKAQGEKRIAKLQMAVAEGERLGVPSQLTRDRLATEIDNVANQYDVDMASVMHSDDLNYNGRYPPRNQMSTTEQSKHWEGASDIQIGESTAEEILSREKPFYVSGTYNSHFKTREAAQAFLDKLNKAAETEPAIAANNLKYPPKIIESGPELQDQWLTKVAPETPVYRMSTITDDDLRFSHLTDELKNSLNPNSGLPPELLLSPNKMPKTVDDVIAHVGKINAWRAAQSAELNKGRAFNPAVVMHKDYPDQPYAWYEFKMPKTPPGLPEGWQIEDKAGVLRARSPIGEVVLGDDLPDVVKNIYLRHPDTPGNPKAALEDALKFEGETMQNCVEGYCPDVVEGRSRIFSLKNKKTGESHTTVETRPGGKVEDPLFDAGVDFEGQAHDYVQRANPRLDTETDEYMEAVHERANDLAAAWNAKQSAPEVAPSRIVQIKGKQNRAPVDKYLPYVQDFVKSQPWGEVGDLKNTGLHRKSDFIDEFTSDQLDSVGGTGEYITTKEIDAYRTKLNEDFTTGRALDPRGDLATAIRLGGGTPPAYATQDEIEALMRRYVPTEGMKDGGVVRMQVGGPAKALVNAVSKRVASSTAEMIAEMMAKNVHPVLDRLQTTVSPKIAHAASTSKETGQPLVQHLTDKERDKIASASLILRRSQLNDIFGPKGRLLNVHESGKTTAAAGAKPSIAIRSEWEPEFLGGTDVNYGYLTSNPLSTTKLPVTLGYSKKGDPYLMPADNIVHYGSYGLELGPEARSRSTYTLGDSLDAGRGNYATAESIVNPPGPYHDIAQPGSILHGLAKNYWDTFLPIFEKTRDSYAAEEMMKSLGFAGSFRDYLAQEGLGQVGARFPRLSPRPINDPRSTPLMNTERVNLRDLGLKIDRSLPSMGADYVEGQVHGGVQPQDITRLYDFNYEPSLAVEKKAKKFGIEYVPMPNDTIYSLVQKEQPQTKRELAELLGPARFRSAKDYLPSDKPQAAWAKQKANEPAFKFGKSFKDGGIVQRLAGGTMADTIKPTETNALQRLLGEVGVIAQKTGKSIDEVLASSSTKGSNVYLTALARMLLADFPQSAGAALQDYTGTTRDITPKQPYHPGVRGGSWNTYQIDPRAFDVMSLVMPLVGPAVRSTNVVAKGATRAVEQGAKNLAVPTDPFFAGPLGSQRGAFNLFGKKPTAQAPTTEVDLSKRRTFRLPEATPASENPLVPGNPIPDVPTSPLAQTAEVDLFKPDVPTSPLTQISPLDYLTETLANKPTSRRDFLKQTGSAIARHMLPDMSMPKLDIAKLDIVKPIEAVAKTMSVVPDDIAAKQIADYAAGIFNNSFMDNRAVNQAHIMLHGDSSEWPLFRPDREPLLTRMLQQIDAPPGPRWDEEALAVRSRYDDLIAKDKLEMLSGQYPRQRVGAPSRKDVDEGFWELSDFFSRFGYGDMAKFPDAAKILGLDLNSVSASTGLPMDTVKRLVRDDSTLLQSLIDSGSKHGSIRSTLEDGRAREAWDMTALDDMNFSKYAKAAVKKLGLGADENDLFVEASDLAHLDFIKKERNITKGDSVSQSIDEQINFEQMYDDVWEQAIDRIDENIYRAVQRAIKASQKP